MTGAPLHVWHFQCAECWIRTPRERRAPLKVLPMRKPCCTCGAPMTVGAKYLTARDGDQAPRWVTAHCSRDSSYSAYANQQRIQAETASWRRFLLIGLPTIITIITLLCTAAIYIR